MKNVKNFKEFINESIFKTLNENFWNWFSSSKTLDEDNKPMIFYHGSDKKLKFFDYKKINSDGFHGRGFYFFTDKYNAESYGNNVYECYLKCENYFDMYKEFKIDEIQHIFKHYSSELEYIIQQEQEISNEYVYGSDIYRALKNIKLRELGFDSIKHGNVMVVFDSNQIKSIKNDGSFDLDDDNIYS